MNDPRQDPREDSQRPGEGRIERLEELAMFTDEELLETRRQMADMLLKMTQMTQRLERLEERLTRMASEPHADGPDAGSSEGDPGESAS